MANKFAFGLVAAGALTGICIGIGQVITEHLPSPEPTVVANPQPEVVAAPVEVAAPAPEYATDAERVKAAATDHMAQSLLERCEQDWLPSTCVQLRAELEAASR